MFLEKPGFRWSPALESTDKHSPLPEVQPRYPMLRQVTGEPAPQGDAGTTPEPPRMMSYVQNEFRTRNIFFCPKRLLTGRVDDFNCEFPMT